MGKFVRFVLFYTILFSITACMPSTETMLNDMYNVPSYGSSKFDGTKHISVSNVRCEAVMLELYQDTNKSQKGIVLLKAGSNTVTNIDDGKSLLLKLDGDTYSFEPASKLTEHEKVSMGGYGVTMPFSNKTYIMPETLIRKAATSKEFLVRVVQLNKELIEGRCSAMSLHEAREQDASSFEITQSNLDLANKVSATKGFQKFVKMMDSVSW